MVNIRLMQQLPVANKRDKDGPQPKIYFSARHNCHVFTLSSVFLYEYFNFETFQEKKHPEVPALMLVFF